MIPAPILLARLEHELERASLLLDTLAEIAGVDNVAGALDRARDLAHQLREAL